MQAVIVTAAVLSILVSAFAKLPEFDHRAQTAQLEVISVVNEGVADDDAGLRGSVRKCDIGHGCIFVILPSNELAVTGFDGAPEFPRLTGHQPSKAGYLPFHPPRILSQV